MRTFFSFVLPLFLVLSVIAYGTMQAVNFLTNHWFMRDLEERSSIIVNAVQDGLGPMLSESGVTWQKRKIAFLNRLTHNERVLAIGYCDWSGRLEFHTPLFPEELDCKLVEGHPEDRPIILSIASGDVFVTVAPIRLEPGLDVGPGDRPAPGRIIVVHNMGFVERRTGETRRYLFVVFLVVGLVTSAVGVFFARWSMRGWVQSVRRLLSGAQENVLPVLPESREFAPILRDVRNLIRELETARTARDESQLTWTPGSLRDIMASELAGSEIVVVANREPYIHVHHDGEILVRSPASGLVTAIEPIVRACSGTWIAHGSGSADRAVVDRRDRVAVPPGNPEYELHRIWLSEQEEQGYYYGFANEGLWPLCHIAHTRPKFRHSDWETYKAVNQKFADAVVADAKSASPVVLVQDYHFALVPRMLRQKLPNAIIIMFWHIPWPNPEAFGICPWREEILDGMLGSTILGFHINYHCHNFLDSVDRFLEARIDRETSSVSFFGDATFVRSYPISIEWPSRFLATCPDVPTCAARVRSRNGIASDVLVGLGVDRLDYTKGLVERFCAIESLLNDHPEWIGRFTFIQIAAPSRSAISAYEVLDNDVRRQVASINARFGRPGYLPIVLRIEHHEPPEVLEYMRASDLCFVSSLHDGMNLVAKEYVASRDDERGVLLLSMFAGASRELTEALIINPYDSEQCKRALHVALSMPVGEQRERMRMMRAFVREFNIYRWAGRILLDAATIRQKNRFRRLFVSRTSTTTSSV